jgi:hypothetical protein
MKPTETSTAGRLRFGCPAGRSPGSTGWLVGPAREEVAELGDRGVGIPQGRILGGLAAGLDGEVLGVAAAGEWVTVAVATSRSVRTSASGT